MNEAVMSGAIAQPEQLSRAERLQLAWALEWPCALLGGVYPILRGQLQLSEVQLQGIDPVVSVLWFFLFTTWVVRWIVRRDFPGFHLVVIRPDAPEGTRAMSYHESFCVAWLMSWRSSVIWLPVYVSVWAVLQRPLQPQELYGPIAWLSGSVGGLLIFYFWLVKAALNKSYHGFSIRLERSALGNE